MNVTWEAKPQRISSAGPWLMPEADARQGYPEPSVSTAERISPKAAARRSPVVCGAYNAKLNWNTPMDPKSDVTFWKDGFSIAHYMVTGGLALYTFLCNRAKARKQDIDDIKTGVEELGDRVARLETGSISNDDLVPIYDRINTVGEQVANISGQISPMAAAVDMIQEYLINNGGKN